MKSLDLFSCIGCHAIGFERAGIETVLACEKDDLDAEFAAASS